jgi:hypothetical protein
MKVYVRYEDVTINSATYAVFLMDNNNNPLEVKEAITEEDRDILIERFQRQYNITEVRYFDDFKIDISNEKNYK